jgi:hypothetical protein
MRNTHPQIPLMAVISRSKAWDGGNISAQFLYSNQNPKLGPSEKKGESFAVNNVTKCNRGGQSNDVMH